MRIRSRLVHYVLGPALLVMLVAQVSCRSSDEGAGLTSVDPVPSASVADVDPRLGQTSDTPHEVGFGDVRPREIYLGGVSSGRVQDISWESWGGPVARGVGVGTYEPPGASGASRVGGQEAQVVVWDLGTCEGVPAYRRVWWYFPQHGDVFEVDESGRITESNASRAGLNACDEDRYNT